MDVKEEKQLVEEAKYNPIAFGRLYDLYYQKIFNYILHRTGNVADATDITSDVFFKVMKHLSKFEWQGVPFSSWVYKIASNEINSYFRKKRFWFLSLETLFENNNFEVADDTDVQENYIEAQKQLERSEEFKIAQQLLKKLPIKYQEVIVLRFFENKKMREISEITGKNTNTVKSLLARGMARLQKSLIQEKGGESRLLETQPIAAKSVIKVEDKNYDN